MSRDPTIVVIGATGFTGRLAARELAATEASPFIVAGRSVARLKRLSASLGARAVPQRVDVTDAGSLDRLLQPGDAVINTAGPFAELGEAVVQACLRRGAHYMDTTGEQPFMRAMYRRHHEAAQRAGVTVVNGMAFEYALGDCAVALAAADLPTPLRSVDAIYAWLGAGSSRGTRRTSVRILGQRAWVRRDGAFHRQPAGARRRSVRLVSGRDLDAVAFGAGEVVTVPRHVPVADVRGWLVLGATAARVAPLLAPALPVVVPLLRPALEALAGRGADPTRARRQESRFTIRLELQAVSGDARALELHGRDPYGLTAAIAVTGARRAREPDAPRGVLAPAELVDPRRLLDDLAPRGLARVPDPAWEPADARNGTTADV